MTQPNESPVQDLGTLRQILFGAETTRLEECINANQSAASAELRDLERRVVERFQELATRMDTQQAETARVQQENAARVTQMLDDVLAQLGHRLDTLVTETRERMDGLQQRATELERRKLNVTDFGGTLQTLGQRFSGDGNGQQQQQQQMFRVG